MIVGLGIIAYVINHIYQETSELQRSMQAQSETQKAPSGDPNLQLLLAAQAQRHEDMQRLAHPLVPPVRRGPFSYMPGGPTVPVSIPTRGEYGSFQQSGYLFNTNTPDQAMPLMGRRIHSNQYEYYTFHHNNPQIKIPIKIQGNKEINDGDTVTVPGYNNNFSAKIYDLDAPRYIPY